MSEPIADERVIVPMPAVEMAELKLQIEKRWDQKPWYKGGDEPMSSPGCMMRAQEILALIASVEAAQAEVKRLNQIAVDRRYMMDAYKAMLGPIGLQVVKRWEEKGVTRQHTYWGPEAHLISGEDRAKALLDAESAAEHPLDFNDSNLPRENFFAETDRGDG